jgi:hypothetical protein
MDVNNEIMEKSQLLELLQNEMLKVAGDIKTEPQIALALDKGLNSDDFMINCDSLFFREYRKDMLFSEIKEEAGKLSTLHLHLSRSGLYDHLPEGLFFQPLKANSVNISATEMAMKYRFNKQRELEMRRFFLPFENDFFWQRVQLESEEMKMLRGLRSGILNDYFIDFWNLPDSIPQAFIIQLILLLPYAGSIAGDLVYTAECLEQLLQETVRIKKVKSSITEIAYWPEPDESQQLGVDFVCGTQFIEDYPVLEFTLGPLRNSQIMDYLEGGNRFSFLQTFYRFFVPAGVDVYTNIEIAGNKRNMQLEIENEPILGYSSFL